jgi:hypothetical protein
MDCNHEVSKLQFKKMFLNDNGLYGGQAITILLECECGYIAHIHSYRGNVAEQYIVPNSGSKGNIRNEFKTFEVLS